MVKILNRFKRINLVTVLIVLLIFVLGWESGYRGLGSVVLAPSSTSTTLDSNVPPEAANIDWKLFWQTWNILDKEYVNKKAIDPQKMYYGAIQGMVSSLGDPYTMFLPPTAQQSVSEQLGGSFEGVGMELGYNKDNELVVIAPLDGTPAQKAGVKAGDLILKINNKDASNISLPDAVNMIRGPKGSQVTLQLLHEGDQNPSNVSITRDTIIVKSVSYTPETTPDGKKVALIKITDFGERTKDEWNQAVQQALSDNSQGVVLDLRNNPGGYLEDAVYIASEFIDSGTIVMQEDGQGQRTSSPVDPTSQHRLDKLPLVVLINKGSASASEIVSGAIQDHKRGELVGTQSFGKGTIQQVENLPNNTGLHVTIAKWLTPNGRWIHNIGLTPDISVDAGTDPTKDPQLDKALEVLDSSNQG